MDNSAEHKACTNPQKNGNTVIPITAKLMPFALAMSPSIPAGPEPTALYMTIATFKKPKLCGGFSPLMPLFLSPIANSTFNYF
jgi:hypothetical protein